MTQSQIIEDNRKKAQERNAELKQQAAARLKKNAEYNKANKPKKSKED